MLKRLKRKFLKYRKFIKNIEIKYFFNTTIYNGKLKFFYTKDYPYYSSSNLTLNGVIFKWKNKYFYTKIQIERDYNFGELYNIKLIKKILKNCNVTIKTSIYNFNLNKNIIQYDDFRYIDKHKYGNNFLIMYSCFTKNTNKYIGDLEKANWLYKNNLIIDDNITGVAFNKKLNTYCGFSHRAFVYFKIGDMIFDKNFKDKTDKTLYTKHGNVIIKNLDDAKLSAINFSNYIS